MFQIMMGVNYKVVILITIIVIGAYVFMGGSHSDILTDAVQGMLMVLIAVVVVACFITAFGTGGGFGEMIQTIQERRPEGHFGKLFIPGDETYGSLWLVLLLFIAHIPFAIQPHLGNNFMAVKSSSELKKLLIRTNIFTTILQSMCLCDMFAVLIL